MVQLIEAAMEKCKVLQVEELDRDASVKETRDVEPRAREEAVAIRSVTNSPCAAAEVGAPRRWTANSVAKACVETIGR